MEVSLKSFEVSWRGLIVRSFLERIGGLDTLLLFLLANGTNGGWTLAGAGIRSKHVLE